MGLTIHWTLRVDSEATAEDVRASIDALRERAMDLPFESVTDVIDLEGDAADFDQLGPDDPLRWFLVNAQWPVGPEEDEDSGDDVQTIRADDYTWLTPTRVIGVTLRAGPGCEPTALMLCRYPGEPGWRGRGSTKTQYASNPDTGGIPAFLRCHMTIVAILDKAKALGILDEVVDEGGFWEERDVKTLVAGVTRMNELVAGFGAFIKGALPEGTKIDAEITAFPNVEHLEAAGMKKLANLAEHFRDLFEN